MQTELTEVMGEKLVLEKGSQNKYHSSTLVRRFYFRLIGTDEMNRYEGYYWRENGTKALFDCVCEKYGGRPGDWEAIYAGKVFPYNERAGSIADFFEGRVQRESLLQRTFRSRHEPQRP